MVNNSSATCFLKKDRLEKGLTKSKAYKTFLKKEKKKSSNMVANNIKSFLNLKTYILKNKD